MSRKKLFKTEDSLFSRNINLLVDKNGGKTTFAETIGVSYDTVRSWCLGEFLPGGAQLYAIHDKFGVSIDWLLTGAEPMRTGAPGVSERPAQYNSEEEFVAQWPEDIRNACRQLKAILLSDHPVIKPALQSNLAAFQYSIEKEKSQEEEIRKLGHRLKFLEDRHKAEENSGADAAASSSTGKPET